MASRCPVLTNHMATLTGYIALHVVLYMDLYVFDTYPYTLKSHIPQKEDKGCSTNTKAKFLKQNILLVILCDEHKRPASYGPFKPELLL